MTPSRPDTHPALGANFIALLAGLWLVLSPWIYGAYGNYNAWNSWIAGVLIFVFAGMRRSHPAATNLCWLNSALGLWMMVSPWIYGYTMNASRLVNSLCIGLIVFCTAIVGAYSEKMSHDVSSTTP